MSKKICAYCQPLNLSAKFQSLNITENCFSYITDATGRKGRQRLALQFIISFKRLDLHSFLLPSFYRVAASARLPILSPFSGVVIFPKDAAVRRFPSYSHSHSSSILLSIRLHLKDAAGCASVRVTECAGYSGELGGWVKFVSILRRRAQCEIPHWFT